MARVRFTGDDEHGLWRAGETAEDLGWESTKPNAPPIRLLRLGDGQLIGLYEPFKRGLVERIEPRRSFDAAASRLAAEEAIERVDEHAEDDFKTEALAAVHYCARHHVEFTTDQVWQLIEEWGVAEPHEPRALGPIVRRAQGLGWIEDTGRVELTEQESAHRRPKRLWRSLCEPQAIGAGDAR